MTSGTLSIPAGAQSRRQPISRVAAKADLLCWAVCVLGLVNVWRIQVLYSGLLSPLRLGLVFTGVALLAWHQANDEWRRWSRIKSVLVVRLVLALLGVILLGVPLGIYPTKSFTFFQNVYLGVFLYFLYTVASVRSRQDIERLLLFHVAGASIYSLFVLLRFQVGESGRLSNLPSYDANDIAMMLVCTMPLAVYFMRKGAAPFLRVLMAGAFIAFAIVLVRSGSRGGFIGFIATMTYLLFRFKGIALRVRAVALVAGLGTVMLAGSDQYWAMMSTLLNPKEDYNYTRAGGRKQIWERGVGYMLTHPVAGVGLNNFGSAEGRSELNRQRMAEGKGWIWAAPHNSFVQVGAELGVTGLAVFIAVLGVIFGYTMRRSSRSPPDPDWDALKGAIAGSLIGYCFAGFFLSQAYAAYLYSLLGIAAAMMKLKPPSLRDTGVLSRVVPASRSRRAMARQT